MLAVLLGLNNAFENPVRQSFMLEMVGPNHLRNAVSLNSVLVNEARSIGPAVAGILIATVGTGVCFLVNAASFVAVVVSLSTLDTSKLNFDPAPGLAPRASCARASGTSAPKRELAIPLLMMAAVGCLYVRVPGHPARPWPSKGLHFGLGRLRLPHRGHGCRRGRRRTAGRRPWGAPG